MLKIIDYAILSSHIYNVSQGNKYGIDIKPIKNGGSIPNGWTIVTDVDPYVQPANHFFAAMYLKFSNGRPIDAVTAFRGTMSNDMDNLLEDYDAWISDLAGDGTQDQTPAYFPQAQRFAYDCRTYLIQHFAGQLGPMNLRYTGHSLGGALAKLIALHGFPGKAIAFNAPGCGHLNPELEDLGKDYVSDFIFNINARYDMINKIGKTIGNLFLVDVPNDEPEAKAILEKISAAKIRDEKINAYGVADKMKTPQEALANDIAGFSGRMHEYTSAVSILKTQKDFRDAYLTCETEKDKAHWYEAKEKLKSCHLIAEIKAYENVIIAQHSIENMIHALTMPENERVGYRME